MKVLHISPTDIRYDSRILKELNALEELNGIELAAFGIDDAEGHKYVTKAPSYIRTFRLRSKRFLFLKRPIRYFLNLIEAVFRLTLPAIKFKPSIVHCHDTLYLPIALLVCSFCKSKLIYDAHELESDKAGQSKSLSKFTLFIERLAWAKIDLLISVSPSIIDWYNNKFGSKTSLLVLNSPVQGNDDRFENNTDENYLRTTFDIPYDSKIYLYLGIISLKGRGIELYLDVFQREQVKGHLVLIGYGEDSDKVKVIAEKFPKIHYHPAVRHDQVVEISKCADVGLCMVEAVSLSDYYCLPNKLFEYAFSGLYILGSDFPDIKMIINEYNLGRCSELNVDSLNAVVENIDSQEIEVNNEDLYQLSWEYQASKLIKEYKILLKK